jgi:hypothetical protein
MLNADGLWYLINGGAAIGQTASEMIRFISERGWKDKLFLSVNLRGNTKDIILNRIVPADIATLNNVGINASKEELRPYHAALALRCVQGRAYLNGTVDAFTKSVILKDAADAGCDAGSVENALLTMIQDLLQVLKVAARKKVTGLTNAVAIAEQESGFGTMVGAIEQRAIAGKAYSILIHNGAEKVLAALVEYEGQLEEIEKAATKKRDAFEAEVRQANNKLDDFTRESEAAIGDLRSVSVDPLANDLFAAVVTDSVNSVAEESARRIYQDILGAWSVVKNLWSKEEKERINIACGAVISEEFHEAIGARLIRWLEQIKQVKNAAYNSAITDQVKRTNERLRRQWEEVDGLEWLRNIRLPEVTGDRLLDEQLLVEAAEVDHLEVPSLVNVIDGQVVASVLLGIIGAIAVLTLHPLGWIALAGAVIWVTLKQFFGKPLSIEVIDKLKTRLAEKPKAGLHEQRQTILDGANSKPGITAQAEAFRDQSVRVFENEIAKLRRKFEATVTAARQTFEQSEAERLDIGRVAREFRETKITPLRQEVKKFRAEVLPLLKRPAENPAP